MGEKWHGRAEFFGLLLIAGSLIFVALQMQQERKIAVAELNSSQLQTFVSRFTAGIESETFLSAYSKMYLTNGWDDEGFTKTEVAALEMDSAIWWVYFEMSFESYREGLMTESAWKEMETEIEVVTKIPVIRAVYVYWWKQMPSEFTKKVDEIIKNDERDGST